MERLCDLSIDDPRSQYLLEPKIEIVIYTRMLSNVQVDSKLPCSINLRPIQAKALLA